MSEHLSYSVVDGVKCYSPEVANDYANYPDSGFEITDDNVESSFWVRSRNRLFKKLVQRHMVKDRKTKFLEIGCGTGDFVGQFADEPQLDITASEIYLKGLAFAKKNLPMIDFVQFDVTKGTIDNQFDIIAAFDVLEHIDEDELALANIYNMLRSGGVAILSVPQYMFMWSALDDLVKHKRRYAKKELVDKTVLSGFDVTYVTSFVFFLFPLMLASRTFGKKRASSEIEAQDLKKIVQFPAFINTIFDACMRLDEFLIRCRISLPFGGTLIAIVRKP